MLLIPAWLGGFFAVPLMLWPEVIIHMPLLNLAVLIIAGAGCGLLTIFLAKAAYYLFIESSQTRDPLKRRR